MKLGRSLVALVVMAACLSILTAYCVQLYRDNEVLRSRYAELLRSHTALSLDHARLRSDYEALSSRFSDLQADYRRLSDQYSLLQDSYSKLEDRYSSLEKSYKALVSEHSFLKSEYASLEARYNRLVDQCVKLNETVNHVIRVANSYGLTEEAIPRVLNGDAIKATATAVMSAGVSETDFWDSMQRIYSYVISNVEYVRDVEIPVWWVSSIVEIDGLTYVCEVKYCDLRNYVQTPELTLEIKQGDCEDQAILVYAMAKYYMREVCEVDYALYLMYVEFYSESAHMAVLLSVQGGRVCIIDPAGRYLTSQYGRIASRPALEELQRYSSYWASHGGVKYVELWDVKLDGSIFVVAKGAIEEVAQALS